MLNPFIYDVAVNHRIVKLSNPIGEVYLRVLEVEATQSLDSETIYNISAVEENDYIKYDMRSVDFLKKYYTPTKTPVKSPRLVPEIKNVIYNDPATIVFWSDGTKTVVKCGEGDEFDPEKGLAMAISKKALGNKGNYYNTFTKWLPDEEDVMANILSGLSQLAEIFKRFNTGGDK